MGRFPKPPSPDRRKRLFSPHHELPSLHLPLNCEPSLYLYDDKANRNQIADIEEYLRDTREAENRREGRDYNDEIKGLHEDLASSDDDTPTPNKDDARVKIITDLALTCNHTVVQFLHDGIHGAGQEPVYPAASDLPEITDLNEDEIEALDIDTINALLKQTDDSENSSNADDGGGPSDDVIAIGNDAVEIGQGCKIETISDDEVRHLAEVVLIHTSLGMARTSFFDSIRLRHFLDAKRIDYHAVDMNRDWSLGHGLVDQSLLESWNGAGLLYGDVRDESKIMCPQLVIDGVSAGGFQDVQNLEDDDDLDWALGRKQCVACFHPRNPGETACASCGSIYQDLIDPMLRQSGRVLLVNCGEVLNNGEVIDQKIRSDDRRGLSPVDLEV